jgi:hypothetical protein
VSRQETVEVHLEELGQHSWLKALANAIGGSYGSAQYRFVACSPAKEHHASDHVVTGATFPGDEIPGSREPQQAERLDRDGTGALGGTR